MLKNRHFQVKIVKDDLKDPATENDSEETISVDYDKIGELLDKSTTNFRETIEMVATKVIIGVAVYVAADTLRKVIVKQTPTN